MIPINFEHMKERILKIMEHEGVGPAQFANNIGIQRASISHILAGRNNPSLEVMIKILTRYPYINPDWLLFGKGEMLREGAGSPDLFRTPGALPQINLVPERAPAPNPAPEKAPEPENTGKAPEKRVSRIMVFYADNTFEMFVPEKSAKE